MNANKNLKFSLLKMKKTGDTIVWLSTIDISKNNYKIDRVYFQSFPHEIRSRNVLRYSLEGWTDSILLLSSLLEMAI